MEPTIHWNKIIWSICGSKVLWGKFLEKCWTNGFLSWLGHNNLWGPGFIWSWPDEVLAPFWHILSPTVLVNPDSLECILHVSACSVSLETMNKWLEYKLRHFPQHIFKRWQFFFIPVYLYSNILGWKHKSLIKRPFEYFWTTVFKF